MPAGRPPEFPRLLSGSRAPTPVPVAAQSLPNTPPALLMKRPSCESTRRRCARRSRRRSATLARASLTSTCTGSQASTPRPCCRSRLPESFARYMCGIAGLLLPGSGEQTGRVAAARQSVTRMVESLRHRGPDDCGHEVAGEATGPVVVLGHTRLAIIDPSPAGRQPMASADGSTLITFNGEIYNFRALRAVLGSQGWRSHSDTEVLLNAYARWRRACVAQLRGMFAFAVWDARRRELFLARDRLGIKPVYYASTEDGGFVFASEVRALLASGLVAPALDPVALSEYLAYQSVPAPRTLVRGVRSLQPGCWLSVDASGALTHGRYWD